MTRIFLLLVKNLLWLSIFGNVHLSLTTTTTSFAVAAESSTEQQDGTSATDTEAETNKRTGTIIGIDLGTTYSCVGVFQKGRVEIISNDQGNRITPSYVSFSTDGSERLVGDAAKNQATLNPTNTIFDIKRLMGRQFNDPSVQADRKLVPYEIVSAGPQDGNKPLVIATITSADGTNVKTKFSPEEISAMILQKLKQTAEKYLGKSIDRAVVTVPAYFNDAQRRATKDAGMIAGLHVERIINEPTAAAIAYGMDHTNKDSDEGELNVLVFDLGGGTFDVTILTIDEGVFEVLSTSGDTHLGGEDFDQRVMQYYVKQILKQHKIDISKNSRSMQKLRKEVERAKRALSSQYQARLEIEDLIKPGTDFSETLTRAKFEELNADLFAKTMGPVQQALDDAMLEKEDIDEIVLVGGSTRIPKVRQLLKDFFGGERELNLSVNPDEAVAYGAAVQGGILSGEASDDDTAGGLLLMDVAPLSLGTETVGGVMTVMIKRGTTIPTEKSMEFVTTEDNQRSMTIDVYEGERSMVQDNHLLGLFEMTNLTPLKRGEVNIRVTFAIDANGILQVTAEDRAQKNIKSITVDQSDGRLKQEDIDRMIREANEFAQQDELLRKKVESRNQLESFVWNLHNTLQEQTNVEEDIKDLLDSVEEVMEWLETNHDTADAEDFDMKYSELDTLSRPIMTKIHRRKAEENKNDDEGDDEL